MATQNTEQLSIRFDRDTTVPRSLTGSFSPLKVLRLQSLLDEGLRREEIEDNEVLGILRTASIDARKKNYRNAARFWIQVLEAKPREFAAGVTFEVSTGASPMIDGSIGFARNCES